MKIGSVVGHRYRITELIGSGGMANVYKAVSIGTHHPVAVKAMRREHMENPEFRRRFEREARAVLHLRHENIVSAYDVGTYDGLPYIIMEYVDGETLKDYIRRKGLLPENEAVSLISQLLNALSAAHAAGIIHRDVKPQNVILKGDGTLKLTDFGIAREADASTRTFVGDTVIGSVHYLSPEQAQGLPVKESTDLYSAGAILYEMLTGEVPFDGDSTVAIALKQISEAPVPPVRRNPALSAAINGIILKALEKDADKRYGSAEDFLRDLRLSRKDPSGSFLEEETAPASRSGKGKPEAQRTAPADGQKTAAKRHPRTATVLVVIAVVTALIAAVFFSVRSVFSGRSTGRQDVPSLVGKQLADAEERAENFGFTLTVDRYETDGGYEYGTVISQTPAAGVSAKQGSALTVVVSLGPESPTVPSLLGKTYEEAIRILHDAGLEEGEISYRVSEEAIGCVCAQTPGPGEDITPGATVSLCISASNVLSVPMPELKGLSLENALSTLFAEELNNVRLIYDPLAAGATGCILEQSVNAESQVRTGQLIVLTVIGSCDGECPYAADAAFNADVSADSETVTVTIREERYGYEIERVVYTAALNRGERIPIAVTARAETPGVHELVLYVGNTEIRRQNADFVLHAAE